MFFSWHVTIRGFLQINRVSVSKTFQNWSHRLIKNDPNDFPVFTFLKKNPIKCSQFQILDTLGQEAPVIDNIVLLSSRDSTHIQTLNFRLAKGHCAIKSFCVKHMFTDPLNFFANLRETYTYFCFTINNSTLFAIDI